MAAGSTYTPIATYTLSSGTQSTVTFSSFSGYTDLVLVYSGRASGNLDATINFNGDTGSNYSETRLSGNGTTASSDRFSNLTKIYLDNNGNPSTVTQPNIAIYHIMNYANTTTYKTIIGRSSEASHGTDGIVGLWRSTAAITSLTLGIDSGSWAAVSTFNLYGITAA